MKSIKNLNITTLEGLSVRNLQRFPSMEWGPEGGMQAELWYNNKCVMTVYQAGNGGCASSSWVVEGEKLRKAVAQACLTFLKRVDEGYKPDSQYEWLQDKTADKLDDDDYEAVINNIEEYYDDVTAARKLFEKGCLTVFAVKMPYHTRYLGSKRLIYSLTEAQRLINNQYPELKNNEILLLRPAELEIL